MESLRRIEELHGQEEAAYTAGNQRAVEMAEAELDQIVTDYDARRLPGNQPKQLVDTKEEQ